jgi:hypothetical protein
VRRVQVSAMLRPPIATDVDGTAQSRFSALRQFRVLACTASATVTCADAADFRRVFTSPGNAFPGGAFRPVAPQLNLRTFRFAPTAATHVRLEVLESQCTGNPLYAGEQDNDPRSSTDCATSAAPAARQVVAAEFQVFSN